MSARRTYSHRIVDNFFHWIIVIALLAGCQGIDFSNPTSVSPASQEKTSQPQQAEITFFAQTPTKLIEGQNLFIEFLDEVTGLALNPLRTRMQTQDGQNFTAKIPFRIKTVLKYRYLRDNDPIGVEYTSQGQQVRYRMYVVDGPGVVHDTIAAWKVNPASSGLGRIQGQVANKSNNSPVVNALVAAGGMQTLTASDGSFLLEGLPPGTHNLVIYSLDGAFRAFQQGAVVASGYTTPALVRLESNKTVKVTFEVTPPQDHLKGAPVRLIGNIFPLGNTFSDLRGGVNVIASRAPIMSTASSGRYSLTLQLPAGLDLRYKYTLGDGFWNAERGSAGEMQVRQLIVPDRDTTIEDTIATWKAGEFAPVSFTVDVPENTPVSDTVSIQFNPFSWTEPIPMWPIAKNRWFYVLYSPLNVFSSAHYRYCRNDQCGTADAADTRGDSAQGMAFSPKTSDQAFHDAIKSWAWFDTASEPVVVSAGKIEARDANFMAGVELMSGYRPSWQPYTVWAFQNIKEIGSNIVTLTPTWHVTHQSPPVIEPLPGQDPLWLDLTQMSIQAQKKGLGTVIHPLLQYSEDPQKWWQSAARDDNWWQSWFDRYRTFILYHADLAAQSGAKALIIGDDSLLPALPEGVLADESSSNVPGDAGTRWTRLLADIRARYTGKIAWMISYKGQLGPAPEFLKENVDLIYIQFAAPLIKSDQPSQADLEASIAAALDGDILKLQEKTNRPVVFGLQFPSIRGAFDGCVDSNGTCLSPAAYEQPAVEIPVSERSLKEQALVYSAALTVINQRSWISGFFAVGYYPPVELKDMSVSIRSKPAADVLWYWYPRLLGQAAP